MEHYWKDPYKSLIKVTKYRTTQHDSTQNITIRHSAAKRENAQHTTKTTQRNTAQHNTTQHNERHNTTPNTTQPHTKQHNRKQNNTKLLPQDNPNFSSMCMFAGRLPRARFKIVCLYAVCRCPSNHTHALSRSTHSSPPHAHTDSWLVNALAHLTRPRCNNWSRQSTANHRCI